MTFCNRCGTEFENMFNSVHWCPVCGKQFLFDENFFKEKREEIKKSKKKKG